MNVKTRHFGDVEIDDSKVITMDNGLFGFENYKKYVLLYDSSSDEIPNIQWLQSLDEELLALPVMIPTRQQRRVFPRIRYRYHGRKEHHRYGYLDQSGK